MKTHVISTQFLGIDKVEKIIESKAKLSLSKESIEAVQKCRDYLDKKMANSKTPVYGVTTGFGSLCNTDFQRGFVNSSKQSGEVARLRHRRRGTAGNRSPDAVDENPISVIRQLRCASCYLATAG